MCWTPFGHNLDDWVFMEDPVDAVPRQYVALFGRKGGIGRTFLTHSLARRMAQQGLQVGILDTDMCCSTAQLLLPEGAAKDICFGKSRGWEPINVPIADSDVCIKVFSLAMMLPSEEPASLAFLPHRKRTLLAQFLQHIIWGPLDILLIDTPPSIGEIHIALLEFLRSSHNASVVLVAEDGSAAGQTATESDIILCKSQGVQLAGIVVNKDRATSVGVEGESNHEEDGALDDLSAKHDIPIVSRVALRPAGQSDAASAAESETAALDALASLLNAGPSSADQ